jgi:predicted Zn-dependent protease
MEIGKMIGLNRARFACIGIIFPLALVAAGNAGAHGDEHIAIDRITMQIAAQPGNIDLYLRRAELQRQHHAFEAADTDYARALAIDPTHVEARWMRARSRLEGGQPEPALAALNDLLASNGSHVAALVTRARTHAKLEHYAESAADYAEAIRLLPDPQPDYVMEWVRAQQLAGIDRAARKKSIDQVIARFGHVPVLEEAALSLEIDMGDWDAALARLERRAASAPRREYWTFRRAQLLKTARRDVEAAASFEQCIRDIDALPPSIGKSAAMVVLARDAKNELAALQR